MEKQANRFLAISSSGQRNLSLWRAITRLPQSRTCYPHNIPELFGRTIAAFNCTLNGVVRIVDNDICVDYHYYRLPLRRTRQTLRPRRKHASNTLIISIIYFSYLYTIMHIIICRIPYTYFTYTPTRLAVPFDHRTCQPLTHWQRRDCELVPTARHY